MTSGANLPPIEAVVPHRGTMLLLDRLLEVSADHAVCEAVVPLDGPFVRNGQMPAWVGIEHMAQTIAAWAGHRSYRAGVPARIGFLLGSRRFESMLAGLPCGARMRIEARCELIGDNGLGMFDCRIVLDGQPVAHARISVYEPDDGATFLANELKLRSHA